MITITDEVMATATAVHTRSEAIRRVTSTRSTTLSKFEELVRDVHQLVAEAKMLESEARASLRIEQAAESQRCREARSSERNNARIMLEREAAT